MLLVTDNDKLPLNKSHKHLSLVRKYIKDDMCGSFTTYIHAYTRLTALCPGLLGSAGTRKVKPIWILLKQEAVASAGPYASLHLTPDR